MAGRLSLPNGRTSDIMMSSSINSSIQQVDKMLLDSDPDETGQAINFIIYDSDKGKYRANSNVPIAFQISLFIFCRFSSVT